MVLLCLGPLAPLALPMVWLNPAYRPATKAVISVLVVAAAVLCIYLMAEAYRQFMNQIESLM